ncbi:MAG: DEAD/DEAH box helicase [Magnetococcales bacterium]|nr:DEAD/DEAH box helicase [Magnetococcales bacterium]
MRNLSLRLTPQGKLVVEHDDETPSLDDKVADRVAAAFAKGVGYGLMQLGACEVGNALPPVFGWWRDFAARYMVGLCLRTSHDIPDIPPPATGDLSFLVLTAPMMSGGEYLNADVLLGLWSGLGTALTSSFAEAGMDLQNFLQGLNPVWNLVGRVHFNLAENRRDSEHPFAFMATYTMRLSSDAKVQHAPLGQALREYAGAANRDKLLSLLLPVQKAAERCTWLKTMVDAGEIFHPLRWAPGDAAGFLASVPDLESAGIVVRMPATWRSNRPARPLVTLSVGKKAPSEVGLSGLLDFQMDVMLDGEPLNDDEIASLLAGTETLVLLRGQWVEIDRERLEQTLRQLEEAEALAQEGGLTFAEAMRMLAGAPLGADDRGITSSEWSKVVAGPWLADTLKSLRNPDGHDVDPGSSLRGTLRPYQKAGVKWLHLLSSLGLGACLADDMGLGKTVQVLSLLLVQAREGNNRQPNLLVVPTSLLANWVAEIERFAPSLQILTVHPSALSADQIKSLTVDQFLGFDLVITSYGSLLRLSVLEDTDWRLLILDEAQAIKNPNAKQTKAAKALKTRARIALTGTPVENHLGDLWSIFDFINPGLLGNFKQFNGYTKKLVGRTHNPYGPLRELVGPYILRRMKTDRSIISDLPDKTEIKAYCSLGRKQAALYGQAVENLANELEESEGIQRKGLILSTMMRLKQICNHPSHWLNDHDWSEEESGKFMRLREIAEVVSSRQEKMLLFTQFRETTGPLASFLSRIFGRSGLVLHGDTAVKKRKELVQAFQEDETVPFFVLSLKAGGSGLNLTAASHVVHFDRWWNPAVENQATDRAFRIGQKKNVLVHKFVCKGTLEEKIDTLLEAKKSLTKDLLGDSGEINVTEMTNDELLRLVAFDLNAVMEE